MNTQRGFVEMAEKSGDNENANTGVMALADGFPSASDDAWHGLVRRILGDRSPDDVLSRKTYDGIAVRPLYTVTDWPAVDEPSGFPGLAPFTRGHRLTGQSEGGWEIRQLHIHPDHALCNAEVLQDLERGVTSVELRLDRAGRRGLDGGQPAAADLFGIDGVCVATVDDLDAVLKGVFLDACAVSLRAGASFLPVSYMFFELLARRGVAPETACGALNADPVAALAENGELPFSTEAALGQLGHLARHVAETYPGVTAVGVDAAFYHDAGASEAQELACALASGTAYLRALTATGLDMEHAFGQIAFTFAADANLFLSIAKLRAARRIWARVAEACGAPDAARRMRLHATTSMRMLSRRDPWVNILRGTVAALGASVAGVDSMTVLPFTAAIGLPDAAARRIARNTQLVLQQESSLSRVVDPAGGSWAIEKLTDAMAQEAWSLFQDIEREGGILASLQSGALQRRIATVAEARGRRIADLSDPLTGTSAFPNLAEQPVAVETVDLARLREAAAARAQKASPDVAVPAIGPSGDVHAAMTKGVRDGAPLAALVGALAQGDGVQVTVLARRRLGEPFERFRDASQAHAEKEGRPPEAFLAAIGALARYTTAAAYARNFLAAGGIDAVIGAGGTDLAEIAKEFQASDAEVAVICSDKAGLDEFGADMAKALVESGAREVFIAGRPADGEPAIDAAAGYIFDGCDVEGILQGILERMGILHR